MKNRKGFAVTEKLAVIAIVMILITLGLGWVRETRQAWVEAERRKITIPYQDQYDETIRNAVNWLLNDPQSPLDAGGRDQFLADLRNGTSPNYIRYEGALSAFSVMEWPNAKEAKKLADSMYESIKLIESAEGLQLESAKEKFEKANEALKTLTPKRKK